MHSRRRLPTVFDARGVRGARIRKPAGGKREGATCPEILDAGRAIHFKTANRPVRACLIAACGDAVLRLVRARVPRHRLAFVEGCVALTREGQPRQRVGREARKCLGAREQEAAHRVNHQSHLSPASVPAWWVGCLPRWRWRRRRRYGSEAVWTGAATCSSVA